MKWRCVLMRRWLPDYPDGELSPFWRRRLEAHLRVCPDCRAELAELREVVRTWREHPLPEPEPGFWEAFDRELHLKLAQVNQRTPEPEPRRPRLPYLLGASALAVLLLFVSYLANFQLPGQTPRLAEAPKPVAPAASAPQPQLAREAPASAPAPARGEGRFGAAGADQVQTVSLEPAPDTGPVPEQVIYVGLNDGLWAGDVPSWDVEAVMADLSPQERQALLKNLSSRR